MDEIRRIRLVRVLSDNQGTFGSIRIGVKGFSTAEPPWRDNKRGMSCLPEGEYPCVWAESPRYGWTYHLKKTEPRTNVLIHWGNWAGNDEEGMKSNTDGCILLGTKIDILNGQRAVIASKAAWKLFCDTLQHEPFLLEIEGRPWETRKPKVEELA